MWTGAQVTNANWEDQWLNEGFTTFTERMIQQQLWGYYYTETEAYAGNNTLRMLNYWVNNTYKSLHPVLKGNNPDDAFSNYPFEKGFQFLYWIGEQVLDYYIMEDFVTYFVNNNNLMSVNAFTGMRKSFGTFIEGYYKWKGNPDGVNQVLQQIDYASWIYKSKWDPTGQLDFSNYMTTSAETMANSYVTLGGASSPSNFADYFDWPSPQKVVFYQTLFWNYGTNSTIMARIDGDYNATFSNDPDVLQRWYSLSIYVNYTDALPQCGNWVGSMGRDKFLYSVFTACRESGIWVRNNYCNNWYYANTSFWTPGTNYMVRTRLGLPASVPEKPKKLDETTKMVRNV